MSKSVQKQKRAIKDQEREELDGALKLSCGGSSVASATAATTTNPLSLSCLFSLTTLPLSPYRSLTASCSAVTRTALGAAGASVVIVSLRAREREKCVSFQELAVFRNRFSFDAQHKCRRRGELEKKKKKKKKFTVLTLFFFSKRRKLATSSSSARIVHPRRSSLSLLFSVESARHTADGKYLKKARLDL